MKPNSQKLTTELVINWHVTEACNYTCKYCYAHWNKPDLRRDVIRDEGKTKKMLTELNKFFHPDNTTNPLQKKMQWSSVRLNIAGGEPLLYADRVLSVIRIAKDLGMNVSIITNGSRLTPHLIEQMAPNLSLFGLSLDSTNSASNHEIGRIDKKGLLLSIDETCGILDLGRQIYPNMQLKINTVVNSVNCQENMTSLIHRVKPDRWKIFRMLPVINSHLAILQTDFDGFVERHNSLGALMSAEDNVDMTESYIMIDPYGRFFQNSQTTNEYAYSPSIIESGAELAFSTISFATDKFKARYDRIPLEMVK